MVLWELTLATAYWLGIRKTYRLALKLQRRVISPKYPRLRDFMHRRTRNVFDIALSVHKKIQSRDLAAEKGVSNFLLRALDRARPSAEIRRPSLCNKETIAQQNTSVGSGAAGKGSTIRETLSVKSNSGNDKVLFSQYVNRLPYVQNLNNRDGGIFGRSSLSVKDSSVSGYRSCTTAGIGWELSQYTFPITRTGSSFRKGVFRPDIAQMMGMDGVNSTAA